jgi:hypothetical protein
VGVVKGDVCIQTTVNGIVLQEVRKSFGRREVIYRNDVEITALRKSRAKIVSSDTTEAVDSDCDTHACSYLKMSDIQKYEKQRARSGNAT